MTTNNEPRPSGWYNDKVDPLTTRYWDGTRWTHERRWSGVEWVVPTTPPAEITSPWAAPAAPAERELAAPPRRGFPAKVVGVVAAVVVVLGLIGWAYGDDDGGGGSADGVQEAARGGSDEDAFVRLVVSKLHDFGFGFDESCVRQYIHDDWSNVESDVEFYSDLNSFLERADVVAMVADMYSVKVPVSC